LVLVIRGDGGTALSGKGEMRKSRNGLMRKCLEFPLGTWRRQSLLFDLWMTRQPRLHRKRVVCNSQSHWHEKTMEYNPGLPSSSIPEAHESLLQIICGFRTMHFRPGFATWRINIQRTTSNGKALRRNCFPWIEPSSVSRWVPRLCTNGLLRYWVCTLGYTSIHGLSPTSDRRLRRIRHLPVFV
jgi:hypothetical protein